MYMWDIYLFSVICLVKSTSTVNRSNLVTVPMRQALIDKLRRGIISAYEDLFFNGVHMQ